VGDFLYVVFLEVSANATWIVQEKRKRGTCERNKRGEMKSKMRSKRVNYKKE
jgi:hypothetical protein